MRKFVWTIGLCLIVAGCDKPSGGTVSSAVRPPDRVEKAAPKKSAESKPKNGGIDWPGFLGPNRNAKSPETGILSPWPDAGPPLVWQRSQGLGYAGCVTSRGRLFLYERFDNDARLTCLDSKTGKLLWQNKHSTGYIDSYNYAAGPRCCPVVDGDRVYTFGVEGRLSCWSVADGKPIWHVDTGKEFGVVQNFFGVGSTPIIEGDLLIASIGGSPRGSPAKLVFPVAGDGSGIVAFDKRTGQVKYKITDELASYSSPVTATINGRRWCFMFARGGLVGFEPNSGKVDFHYPWKARLFESVNASSPVVVGDQVFISETYGPGSTLLKVRPGGYDVVWKDDPLRRAKAMQTHWNTVIAHRGYLYGSSGRNENNAELRCVRWSTGEVMWGERGLLRSSLLYVDDHLICLSEDGILRLLKANPEKYDVISKVELLHQGEPALTAPAWAAPVLSHGLLYVRGKNRLLCLELIPGSRK